HGALYNTIAYNQRQAADVITALLEIDSSLVLMALAGSPLLNWARERGLRVVAEAFADRAYTPGGELVSRREPGSVLHDPVQVADRMLDLVNTGELTAIDGSRVRL